MPLEVIYGPKTTSVWEVLSGVVDQISSTFQRVQKNKFEKQVMQTLYDTISDPANKVDVEAELSQLENPPQEIINPPGLNEFASKIAGKLQQKEIMMGNLPAPTPQVGVPSGVIPTGALPTKTQQEELPIASDDFQIIFNAISALPTAPDIDFSEVTDLIFANFDKKWGNTALTQGILSNIMTYKQGQLAEQDPRARLEENLALTKKYRDILYPEEETRMPGSLMELWLTDPERAKEYQEFKEGPPKPELDYDELNKIAEEQGLEMTGFNFNPATNNVNFSVGRPPKPDEPKPTLSENLMSAEAIIKATSKNGEPTLKIGSVNPGTGYVGLTSITVPGAGQISTADVNYLDKFNDIKTADEYDTLYNKTILLDPRLKSHIPSKEKVFRGNYDKAVAAMENVVEASGIIKEGMFNEDYTNEQIYQAAYVEAVFAAQEYQKATGKTIEVPYESLETYLRKDVIPRDLLNPASWGTQRSVYKAGAITFAFVKEMLREGKTLDDYSPEVLIKAGIDIDLALQYYNQYQFKGR